MEARAVKSHDFKQVRQFLSGYPQGFQRQDVWRVEIEVGSSRFYSSKTYSSEASAKAAAKRLQDKQT